MTLTPLLLTVLLLTVFSSGVACTLAMLMLLERRILARPGAKIEVATRLLDESAREVYQ